tara:strand:+ start:2959 stop:3102 length:144 start_codon:yes stop_codon:yes gene_type:complete
MKKKEKKKSIISKIPSWMLWIPALIFIVFFVWIVKIAFDGVAMMPGQ